MKISSIKQQIKNNSRYSIFVDGKYEFSLTENQLLESDLKNGLEISAQDLKSFKELSDFGKIYERVLNLLSFRPRSRWEIEQYLKRKKQNPVTSQKIIDSLSEKGYIDDKQFAQRWLENRRLLKVVSKRKLRQELLQKRIESKIIDGVLASDETDELETLRTLVKRKKARYPDRLKFMQYLARQGYNYDDIKTVLNKE